MTKDDEIKPLNIVKRVCADIYISLTPDVVKSMQGGVPIIVTCDKKQTKIIKEATDSNGDITFTLMRVDEEQK